MKTLSSGPGKELIKHWNHWQDVNHPLYHSILAPVSKIERVTTYEFLTWSELVDTLKYNNVKVTNEGCICEEIECSFHILRWEDQIVGYCTNPFPDEISLSLFEYNDVCYYRAIINSCLPIFEPKE